MSGIAIPSRPLEMRRCTPAMYKPLHSKSTWNDQQSNKTQLLLLVRPAFWHIIEVRIRSVLKASKLFAHDFLIPTDSSFRGSSCHMRTVLLAPPKPQSPRRPTRHTGRPGEASHGLSLDSSADQQRLKNPIDYPIGTTVWS